MLRTARALLLTAVATSALAGCAARYIPNTDVEDSDDNRKVITFCERYRHDVELKDVGDLLKMAAKEYYEDGGNVDASDDLDFAGLKEYLTTRFDNARAIRYEMRYRRIVRQQIPERDRNQDGATGGPGKNPAGADPMELIYVDYTYSASYRIPAAKGGDEWRRRVEDNRLEILRYSDNSYSIIAGM